MPQLRSLDYVLSHGYRPSAAVRWDGHWYLTYKDADGPIASVRVDNAAHARDLGARDWIHMCDGVDTITDRLTWDTSGVIG